MFTLFTIYNIKYASGRFAACLKMEKEENVSQTINRNLCIHMAYSFNYHLNKNLNPIRSKVVFDFHTFISSNSHKKWLHEYEAIIYQTLIIIRISNKINKKDWRVACHGIKRFQLISLNLMISQFLSHSLNYPLNDLSKWST